MFNYIYIILYILSTALSVVFINQAAKTLPPPLTLFMGTLIAILFFHLINVTKLKQVYQQAWKSKRLWLKVMITIAGLWLCSIYGPALVAPAVMLVTYFSSACLLGVIFQYKQDKSFYLLIAATGILICTIFIVADYLNRESLSWHIMLGIFLSILGGILNFIYGKQSYQLSKESQLSTTQILAIRFWIVEIFCLILFPKAPLSYFNWHNTVIIITISLVSLILPIFFYLKGIFKIGIEKSAVLSVLIPATGYVLQSLVFHQHNIALLLLYLATGFFISFPGVVRLFKKHRHVT